MMRSLLRWVFPIHLFQTNVAAAIVGSAVVGGAINANASKSAAGAQAGAADRATAAQEGMFNRTVQNNAPYNQAGQAASARLSNLLGIGTPQQIGPNGQPVSYDPITQAYHDIVGRDPEAAGLAAWQARLASGIPIEQIRAEMAATPEAQGPHGTWQAPAGAGATVADPAYGSLAKPFSMEDFHLDPGIQFQTQQGNLALTNSAAAKNGVLSGGALKDFIAYNQGMAGTGYQSAYDRYMQNKQFTLGSLMGVSQLGQTAASNGSTGGSSYAQGIAGTMTGAGNATAAGTMGAGNAMAGGISGAANGYTLSRFLNNGGGAADMGGPITSSANPNGVYIAPAA